MQVIFSKISLLFLISIGIIYAVISFLPLFINDLEKRKNKNKNS